MKHIKRLVKQRIGQIKDNLQREHNSLSWYQGCAEYCKGHIEALNHELAELRQEEKNL